MGSGVGMCIIPPPPSGKNGGSLHAKEKNVNGALAPPHDGDASSVRYMAQETRMGAVVVAAVQRHPEHKKVGGRDGGSVSVQCQMKNPGNQPLGLGTKSLLGSLSLPWWEKDQKITGAGQKVSPAQTSLFFFSK